MQPVEQSEKAADGVLSIALREEGQNSPRSAVSIGVGMKEKLGGVATHATETAAANRSPVPEEIDYNYRGRAV